MDRNKLRITVGCAGIYLFCACILGLGSLSISSRLAGVGSDRSDLFTPLFALGCSVANGLMMAIPVAYWLSRRLIRR